MARKKLKPQPKEAPPPVKPEAPSFWETRAFPFLEEHSLLVAVLLIAIATIRIVATYPILSMTIDEPGHFACGLEYVAKHVYNYESQHPPLARAMIAVGPYLDGARPMGVKDRGDEAVAILFHSGNPDRILNLMRLGILPFFFLACMVVYWWARHYFGNSVAAIATGLFTMLPPVLAHAGLATTDMAVAACLGAAFLSLALWAESPTWKHGLLLGVTTGMAVLSKFTALAYFPAAAAFALLAFVVIEKPGLDKLTALAKERAATFGLAVVTGALLIWAGYFFSFGKVPVWNVTLPAPEFFDGIRSALSHNEEGHRAYLFGQVSTKGWWYYFPAVLSVKTPIAFLLLVGLGLYLCWKNRAQPGYWLPVAFLLGILTPAMTGNVNIGVRHVLPVYIGFSIMAALALLQLIRWSGIKKWAGPAAGVLVVWLAVTGAASHPDYLSYFNELVPSDRETVLVDSDFDWGQDSRRLAKRLREVGATEVNYGPPNHLSDYLMKWPGLPPFKPIHPAIPAEGWTVISPTIDRTTQYGLYFRYPNVVPWYDRLTPVEHVGALRLYYIAPGTLRRAQ